MADSDVHREIHQAGPEGIISFCAAGCKGRWPCASASDLTGHQIGEWGVTAKAKGRARWTVEHHPCGLTVDVGQAAIRSGDLPPCAACKTSVPAPAEPMHLACGQHHPESVPCEVVASVVDHFTRPLESDRPLDLTEVRARMIGSVQVAEDVHGVHVPAIAVRATADRTASAILDVIRAAMLDNPRSLQVELGPSELGGCERRLGHRIAFGKPPEVDTDALWRPMVGTAVHAWLADIFGPYGSDPEVWLSAKRVLTPIEGELDLFHRESGTVVDFKVTGETTRKRALRRDVDAKYETQLDLYGAGLAAEGHDVRTVALLFLPASGSLKDAVWYARPFDPANAARAVERYRRVQVQVDTARLIGGDDAVGVILGVLPIEADNCAYCPALGRFCEGAPGANLWSAPPADPVWPAWEEALAAEARAS